MLDMKIKNKLLVLQDPPFEIFMIFRGSILKSVSKLQEYELENLSFEHVMGMLYENVIFMNAVKTYLFKYVTYDNKPVDSNMYDYSGVLFKYFDKIMYKIVINILKFQNQIYKIEDKDDTILDDNSDSYPIQ